MHFYEKILLVFFILMLIIFYAIPGETEDISNMSENSEIEITVESLFDKQHEIRDQIDVIRAEMEEVKEILQKEKAQKELYLESPKVLNLCKKSNISIDMAKEMLKDTELEHLAEYYVAAEQEYDINAIFLIALSIHESNWGTSRIARQKNNLFGFRAYDSAPFENAHEFKHKRDSIITVARYLKKNYLTEGNKHFAGYTIRDISRTYAGDHENWAKSIINIVDSLQGAVEVWSY